MSHLAITATHCILRERHPSTQRRHFWLISILMWAKIFIYNFVSSTLLIYSVPFSGMVHLEEKKEKKTLSLFCYSTFQMSVLSTLHLSHYTRLGVSLSIPVCQTLFAFIDSTTQLSSLVPLMFLVLLSLNPKAMESRMPRMENRGKKSANCKTSVPKGSWPHRPTQTRGHKTAWCEFPRVTHSL